MNIDDLRRVKEQEGMTGEEIAEYKYDDIIASRVLEGFEIRIADFINQFQN